MKHVHLSLQGAHCVNESHAGSAGAPGDAETLLGQVQPHRERRRAWVGPLRRINGSTVLPRLSCWSSRPAWLALAPSFAQACRVQGLRRPHLTTTSSFLPRPAAMDAFMASTHIVSSIPPAGLHLYDPVTRAQLALLRHRVEAAAAGGAPPLRWLGVLSSTSVYGDHGGAWVDEE